MSWLGGWLGAEGDNTGSNTVVVASGRAIIETEDATAVASPNAVAVSDSGAIATASTASTSTTDMP